MTKLTIIFGVLCLVKSFGSAHAYNPFPCPEDNEPTAIDYSRAFFTSTQMECQSKSEDLGATANLWADIGVCFPLFDEALSIIKKTMVVNSDHWCFGKDSYKAIPAFKEAIEFRRINEIGKKKAIAGINDVNTKEKNIEKKDMKRKKKNKKQGTRGGERALTLDSGTNFWVDWDQVEIEDIEFLSDMNMYLGCEQFCGDDVFDDGVPIEQVSKVLIYFDPKPY
jgi:hypothetical protein